MRSRTLMLAAALSGLAIGQGSVAQAAALPGTVLDVAANPVKQRVYAAVQLAGGGYAVAVLNANTGALLPAIPVADSLRGLAVNQATNRIYTRHPGQLQVINGQRGTILKTVTIAGTTRALAVDAAANRVYVAVDDHIAVVNGQNNTVIGSIDSHGPVQALAVDALHGRIFVLRTAGGVSEFAAFDLASGAELGALPFGTDVLDGLAVNAQRQRAYLAHGDSVTVIDTAALASLGPLASLGSAAGKLVADPARSRVYVRTADGYVNELNEDTLQFTLRVLTNSTNSGLALDATGKWLYSGGPGQNLVATRLDELLRNASLEYEVAGANPGWPANWETFDLVAGADTLVTGADIWDGAAALHLTGAAGVAKVLRQITPMSGATGTVLRFEASSKTTGSSATGSYYKVFHRIRHLDGSVRNVWLRFTPGTHGWETQSARITMKKPFDRITTTIEFVDQAGEAWFDGLHAWVDQP